MDFIQTKFPEVFLIKPRVFEDNRGYFMESFRNDLFLKHVGEVHFIQDNESKSTYGVLRGLHYQLPPHGQSKLVRAVTGKVLDVVVDIRRNSPTIGRHITAELSEENKHQLFIPRGFAHGFVTLSETAIFSYKVDALYNQHHEHGINYADPALKIEWGLPPTQLRVSDKDRDLPFLENAELFKD